MWCSRLAEMVRSATWVVRAPHPVRVSEPPSLLSSCFSTISRLDCCTTSSVRWSRGAESAQTRHIPRRREAGGQPFHRSEPRRSSPTIVTSVPRSTSAAAATQCNRASPLHPASKQSKQSKEQYVPRPLRPADLAVSPSPSPTFPLDGQPFSRAGSYLTFNYLSNVRDRSSTVGLRSVHGGIPTPAIFDLVPAAPSSKAFDASFEPDGALSIPTATANDPALASFDSPTTVRITAPRDLGLALAAANLRLFDTLTPLGATKWQFIKRSSDIILGVEVVSGSVDVETKWHGEMSDPVVFHLAPGTVVTITERVDDAVAAVNATQLPSYAEWLANAPPAPGEYAYARALAAYVTWHTLVAPSGQFSRPAMYMSKNWMASVWSWDHCFNAQALGAYPALCWGQIATMFEHQSARGNLPDSLNDREITYAFMKPPVHGWTIDKMHAAGVLGDKQVKAALGKLDKWTDFWLTERVGAGRVLPAYYHGNDSGWDNSTVFDLGVPVESPDLASHLVLQLDSLARVATRLGLQDKAAAYTARADALFATLVETLWAGDRFTARHVPTNSVIDGGSLLLLQPLMLGARLPSHILTALVSRLETGGFITPFGLATESTASEKYTSDGYWRGPVWAPSTLLIVDGLKRAGETELAAKIARAFCNAFQIGGSAENFNALTGAANRDTAYSWTASVFLVLASEYL